MVLHSVRRLHMRTGHGLKFDAPRPRGSGSVVSAGSVTVCRPVRRGSRCPAAPAPIPAGMQPRRSVRSLRPGRLGALGRPRPTAAARFTAGGRPPFYDHQLAPLIILRPGWRRRDCRPLSDLSPTPRRRMSSPYTLHSAQSIPPRSLRYVGV